MLALAREEAGRLHHPYVGTEYVLLGLLGEGEGVAATMLENLAAPLDDVREKIESMVKPGTSAPPGPNLPYTSRAKKVLELAMKEASSWPGKLRWSPPIISCLRCSRRVLMWRTPSLHRALQRTACAPRRNASSGDTRATSQAARSAPRGSMRLARVAGIKTATRAIANNSTGTPTNTSGSRASMPYSIVFI